MSIDSYLDGKSREGVALFRHFSKLAQACGDDVGVSMTRTAAHFKRQQEFASGSVQRRELEVVIDLLREVDHPCLQQTRPVTTTVFSHTLKITSTGDIYTIVDLLQEAYDTVGPGAR